MTATLPLKYAALINRNVLSEDTAPDFHFRYVDIGSVASDGTLTIPEESLTFGNAPSRARRLAPAGATAISTVRTYLRAIAHVPSSDDVLVFSTGFAIVEPLDRVDQRYLYYACRSDAFVDAVVARSSGVSYPAINPSDLACIPIPLPELDEQRRIADFLDEQVAHIDNIIAARGRQLGLVGLELQAKRIEIVGALAREHRSSRLGRHVACLDGRRVPLNATERASMPGPFPYWGAGSIVDHLDHYLFDETLVLLGEDGAPFFDPMRDVSFVVRGKVWVNNHIHVLRPLAGLDADYLCHVLNAVDYADFISGSTRDKLTQEQMRAIPLPLPPLAIQRQAVAAIDIVRTEVTCRSEQLARSLSLLQEMKSSLITAAVAGGFDVSSADGSRVSP